MKIVVHLIIGSLLRLFFYFSPYWEYFNKLFTFPISSYSFSNLKENYAHNIFKPKNTSALFQSESTFISPILTHIYNRIKTIDNIYILIFFILCDITISIILYKSKRVISLTRRLEKLDDDNDYIVAFYMYNPISIINCIIFRLDIIYTMINLILVSTIDNALIAPIFFALSILLSPGYIIITFTYICYVLMNHLQIVKISMINCILMTFSLFAICNVLGLNIIQRTKEIYINYFFLKDSLPNFSYLWSLITGTFLKYQNYSLQMLIIYQITLSFSVMLLVNRLEDKDYKSKGSLAYALIFLMTHILDRYPPENHYIISLVLLFPHWSIIKTKITNLSVYGSVAGYTLIVCRGFPFMQRKSGSANYLFFQNVTYLVAMTFLLMCSVSGIEEFRKSKKIKKEKIEEKKDDE